MSETDLNPPLPDSSPLRDATGDQEPADELTDPELPPVPASPATDSTDSPAPIDVDDPTRPDPCTAMGGQS